MKNKKLILCIGGSNESLIGIKTAKKMGFGIIVADYSKKSKAIKICDYFINESTKNSLKILKKIKTSIKKNIVGVISFGNDVPFEVNFIAKKLKLKYYNLKAAKILSNKLLIRKFLKKNKINSTSFHEIKKFHHLKKVINKYPLGVIKPVDSSGARGVFLLKKKTKNIKKIFFNSLSFSKSKTCIFEKFINGDQLSTETVIYNNSAYTFGISDRNYSKINEFYPNIIEDGSDMPSKYENKFKESINKLMLDVARKLKIDNCILKGDLVVNNNKIYVVEIAGRLSGGNFSSIMIPRSVGINLIKCAIKLCANLRLTPNDLEIKYNNHVSQRFIFTQKKGVLKEIKLPKWIKNSKKLVFKELNYSKGDKIEKITNHTNRLGQIIVCDKNKKKTVEFAKRVIRETKLDII